MDNTLQYLYLLSVFVMAFRFGLYTAPQSNALIAFICLFYIFRVLYVLASALMLRGQTLTAVVKLVLTFVSLVPLIILWLWGFIAAQIALKNTIGV
jgi:hypothetical protein